MKRVIQRYVSLAEGAAIVGVSVDTLRRRIRAGVLPAVRDGKLIRVLPEDLYSLFKPMPTAGLSAVGRYHLADKSVAGRTLRVATPSYPSPWRDAYGT